MRQLWLTGWAVEKFKGTTGTGASYFPRPLTYPVTYVVLMDVETDSVAIQNWATWDWTQESVDRSVIDGCLGVEGMEIVFTASGNT